MYAVDEIEDAVAEAVAGIDAADYAQGKTGDVTLRRSEMPLTASTGRQLWDHLSFSASLEDVVAHDGDANDGPAPSVAVLGDLRVPFVFRVRHAHQLEDARGASRLARKIVGLLLGGAVPDVVILPRTLYRPGPVIDDFMTVDLRFAVLFDLSIPRPA